ncbi:MAG: SAM-dependent MidA family methyltransferase [Pseudoalteromonas tetraodonis]|jgi:SAM-dependent MidA family methyltransferase
MQPSGNSQLIDRIRTVIGKSASGSLPFAEFMRLALYDPDFGYYAAGSEQRVGRAGDFYTSVSVGKCFGNLLAAHFLARQPDLKQVVEQGANDGQLAADLLAHLPANVDYLIVEPFESMREIQREKLGERARWVERIEDIPGGITGRFICNELLDALPVQRVHHDAEGWKEIHIDAEFNEVHAPITSIELQKEIAAVLADRDLPDDYTTELHLSANQWAQQLHASMLPGSAATIIDYGHQAGDYYSPERSDGTLRGYRDHQQVTRYLEHIGETDLTASVNFSRIAEILGAGKTIDQHHFLIEAAKPWLKEIESTGQAPDAATQKLLRQFNTLIHPGMLGQSFKVLEFER